MILANASRGIVYIRCRHMSVGKSGVSFLDPNTMDAIQRGVVPSALTCHWDYVRHEKQLQKSIDSS